MEAIGLFFLYALVAIFLENAVFTRMLGVGRMVFLGTPKRILAHGAALTVITFFGSTLSFAANYLLYDYNVAVSLRALIYLCCLTVVYLILYLLCDRLPGKIFTPMKKLLPLSLSLIHICGSSNGKRMPPTPRRGREKSQFFGVIRSISLIRLSASYACHNSHQSYHKSGVDSISAQNVKPQTSPAGPLCE